MPLYKILDVADTKIRIRQLINITFSVEIQPNTNTSFFHTFLTRA